MTTIRVEHVSHAFPGTGSRAEPLLVLDDLDFSVPAGAFVSILGPTGCGKTTLLRIIQGLVRPTTGRVLVDGASIEGPSADRAMVFQEFNLLPWRTALSNVELGLEIQGIAKPARRAAAWAALRQVDLEGFARHYPHQLSGGMKQRLGLARALCTKPRCLLMDEPFGALDMQTRELMQIEVTRLWEASPKTVLFVTHSVDEAVFLSDWVVVLSARPARALEAVEVCLPRPRARDDGAVRSARGFAEQRDKVWQLLKQQPANEGPGVAA